MNTLGPGAKRACVQRLGFASDSSLHAKCCVDVTVAMYSPPASCAHPHLVVGLQALWQEHNRSVLGWDGSG